MLTVVLIIALIGVAFAWYTANTTVTASSTATAAEAENASLNFVFTAGDDSEPIYLSGARILKDYYNRDIYTGEEGYSAVLGAMVDNVSIKDSNSGLIRLLNPKADGATAEERLGTRDHVFTMFYMVELAGKSTSFDLKLDAVKIYKNGVTVRTSSGTVAENAAAEYPAGNIEDITKDDGTTVPNTVAKVSVRQGADTKTYYFDATQATVGVFESFDLTTGELTAAVADASYDKTTCTLTSSPFGTETYYVLSGHQADKDTKTARYFASDDEETATETEAVKNFTFNCYAVTGDSVPTAVYNKAHLGDYKLYTKEEGGTEAEYATPATTLTTGAEGAAAIKVIVGITYFAPIEDAAAVTAAFPYSSFDYMKAHFKFTIKAGLAS